MYSIVFTDSFTSVKAQFVSIIKLLTICQIADNYYFRGTNPPF